MIEDSVPLPFPAKQKGSFMWGLWVGLQSCPIPWQERRFLLEQSSPQSPSSWLCQTDPLSPI